MKNIVIGLCIALASTVSLAKKLDGAPVDDAPSGTQSGLKIATGPAGKGYSNLFRDIKAVCGNTVSLQELNTDGGLGNLNALSLNKAKLGFAQIDAFVSMKAIDENIGGLLQVIPLNHNYLHIVVSSKGYVIPGAKKWGGLSSNPDQVVRITAASQLRGKKVALVGSAQLLGRKLDKSLGFGMQFIDVATDADAFKLVQTGNVHAAFTVSGWPSGTVDKLEMASGLTLVPFDVPAAAPFTVKAITYRKIGVWGVQALASRNVLFTRPFKGSANKEVAKLKACIAANLPEMQDGEYEPGWNEVKDVNQNIGIEQFK